MSAMLSMGRFVGLLTSKIQRRWATRKVKATSRNGRDSHSKRLGTKKINGENVNAGEILFKQKGARIHPGPNAALGSDYTLYARCSGIVHYYKAFRCWRNNHAQEMVVKPTTFGQVLTPETHPRVFDANGKPAFLQHAILETNTVRRSRQDAERFVNIRQHAQDNGFVPRVRTFRRVDEVVLEKVVTDALSAQLGADHWMVRDREAIALSRYGFKTGSLPPIDLQ